MSACYRSTSFFVFLNEACFSIFYLWVRVCVQSLEEDFQELVSCLTRVLGT